MISSWKFLFKKFKMFLYGYHTCINALLNPKRQVTRVYLCDPIPDIKALNINQKLITMVSKKELQALVPQGSVHQNIVVEVNPLQSESFEYLKDKTGCVVVLDQITDPHNIGAIFRSACVFNAIAIILLERNMPKETNVITKSACGAFDKIPFIKVNNLSQALNDLKDLGFWTVGLLEEGEQSICDIDLKGKVALIFGSEGKGIRSLTKKNCDFLAYIPTNKSFSALNVSVAAAITLFEVYKQSM